MSIKLVVCDLDGTLLNSNKIISLHNISIIKKAASLGINTSIATGRMHASAAFFGKILNTHVPVISCNGGMIRHTNNNLIFESYIDDEVAEEILQFLFKHNIYCSWYSGINNFVPYFSWNMFPDYKTVKTLYFTETGQHYKNFSKKITQFILRDNNKLPSDLLARLYDKFNKYVCFQQNTGYTIDITPLNTNKGTGLKKLAQYLNIFPSEIAAIGDGDNDLSMFTQSGYSIAMGNAKNNIKNNADAITTDCDNDGVANVIKNLLKSRGFHKST